MKWDADTKAIWLKVALCGGTITKRLPMRTDRGWMRRTRWYIAVPAAMKKDYVMGPYDTKSEAVLRAAELMEIIGG